MPKGKGKSKGKGKGKKEKKEEKKEVEKENKADKIIKTGYACLYLGDKELQGYGFKTGDGLLDVAPFKTLKKADIIEEIQFKGKMCAFQPFQEVIEKYQDEDLLFIWDPDEEKEADCNFYFCCNPETFQAEKTRLGISDDGLAMDPQEILRLKQEKEEEEKRRLMEEEKKKEEERIAAAIQELKKPLIPRKWTDLGSFDEILNMKMKQNRIRKRISISRKRKYFGQNIQLSDQENVDGMNIEIKSLQSGSSKYGYDVYKKLVDRNNQIGHGMMSKSTQTNWYRKINKIVQYQFNEESVKYLTDGNDKHNNLDSNISSTTTQTQTFDFNHNGFGDELKSMENIENDKNEQNDKHEFDEDDMNEKLEQFLEDIYDELHDILTDNNLVNIFEDDFNLFIDRDKELGLDTKTENIKELQTFVDLNWSRGKKISDIHWMPSSNNVSDSNMVAVSCTENMSFDDRVNIMNKSRISTILLWNLSHILLKAQTILTAPTDIFTFKFHPYNKNIIIGGLETGQVVLWDLNDYHNQQQQLRKEQNNNDSNHNEEEIDSSNNNNHNNKNKNNNEFEDDEDEKIPQIQPKMLSYIEKSHTKCVSDILWLPQDIMITSSGDLKYIDIKNRPKGAKRLNEEQFMSIAGDGSILFWDIQIPKQTEKEKKKNEPAKWLPIYHKKLSQKDLSENIFTDKEAMDLAHYDPTEIDGTSSNNNNDDDNDDNKNDGGDHEAAASSSDIVFGNRMCYTPLLGKIVVGTELGEYCLFNYGKITKEFITERQSLLLTKSTSVDIAHITTTQLLREHENDTNEKPDIEKYENELIVNINNNTNKLYKQHFLDIKSISISPHFNDIYLTIGDWRFCIWRNNKLIFQSPYSSSYICCGCWSPTRPAVIITAKYDGSIDIWDLLDQTHSPVFKNSPISSVSITSIIFSPFAKYNKNGVQQLAVGDANGNLRILQIPRNFAIPLNNEKLLMAQFYQKEYIRIQFINKRYQIHKQKTIEIEKDEKERKEKAEQENEADHAQNNHNNNDNHEDGINDEMKRQIEMDKQLENKYQNMLVAFKKQLGIKDN